MSQGPPPPGYRQVPPPQGYDPNTGIPSRRRRRAAAWYRVIALIWLVVAVIDVFIAARFLLMLLGASQESAFVSFVYGVSAPFVAPFEGIFGTPARGANVFEAAALVAIVVYLLIAVGLVTLLRIVSGRRQPDVPYDAPR